MVTRWRGMLAAVLLLVPWTAWAQSSLPFTFHAGATATGNGTLMQADYYSTIHVQIEGTFVGRVVFEGKTKDASGYALVQCNNRTDGTRSTEADVPGYWDCPGGAYNFRVRVSAYTSGTIVVTGTGTTAVSSRGSGTTAQGLNANFDINPNINGAIVSKPFRWGDGVTDNCAYTSGTLGPLVKPCTDADVVSFMWNGFGHRLWDIEGSKNFWVIDPDAFATGSGTITFQTGEQVVLSNLGVEFAESDTNPTCATGNYNIHADSSEKQIRHCQDGILYPLPQEGVVVKPSDEPTSSDTGLSNDTHLFFAAAANTTYSIDLLLLYNSNTTADFKYNFTLPAGAFGYKSSTNSPLSTSSCSDTSVVMVNNDITQTNANVGGAGAVCALSIQGLVFIGGTAGNVRLQWAQVTSDAGNTTVIAGSVLRWRKLS